MQWTKCLYLTNALCIAPTTSYYITLINTYVFIVALAYRGLLFFRVGLVALAYRGLLFFRIGLVALAYRGLLFFQGRPCSALGL